MSPLVPLIYKYIFEDFSRFKNKKKIISKAVSIDDFKDLLRESMNIEKIKICDKTDIKSLMRIFDKFDIKKEIIEVIEIRDDDFHGCFWYGYTDDFIFLSNYIKYD